MIFDTNFLYGLFPTITKYSWITLKISIISFFLSLIIAILIALTIYMNIRLISSILNLWVAIFRGTPLITQMFFVYFGLAQLIPLLKDLNGQFVAIMVLSFNSSAHMSEILRGAIIAIDKGQIEAGLSIGMSYLRILRRIILPQAIINSIPALGNSFVEIVKGSAIAFTIGVKELMGAAQLEGTSNYKYLETFAAVMIAYFIITSSFNILQRYIEKKFINKYSV